MKIKVKIKTDKGEKEIELNNPKRGDTKKGFKLLTGIDSEGSVDLPSVNKYTDFIDEMALKYSGLSMDEFENLEDEEAEKATAVLSRVVADDVDVGW